MLTRIMLRTLLAVRLIFSHVCSTVVSTSLSAAVGEAMIVRSDGSMSTLSDIPKATFCAEFCKFRIVKLSLAANSESFDRPEASTGGDAKCL